MKFPDKERSELTKKRDVVYIENGDQGYEVTYKGTTLQDPEPSLGAGVFCRGSCKVVPL